LCHLIFSHVKLLKISFSVTWIQTIGACLNATQFLKCGHCLKIKVVEIKKMNSSNTFDGCNKTNWRQYLFAQSAKIIKKFFIILESQLLPYFVARSNFQARKSHQQDEISHHDDILFKHFFSYKHCWSSISHWAFASKNSMAKLAIATLLRESLKHKTFHPVTRHLKFQKNRNYF